MIGYCILLAYVLMLVTMIILFIFHESNIKKIINGLDERMRQMFVDIEERRKPSAQSGHDDADDTIVGYTLEEDGSWRQVFLKVPQNNKLRNSSAPRSLPFDELIALILKNQNTDPSQVDVYVASILRARKIFSMEAEQEL